MSAAFAVPEDPRQEPGTAPEAVNERDVIPVTPPLLDASIPLVDPSALPAEAAEEIPLLESLVAGAVTGEKQAVERLLREIQPLVQRYCRGRLGRQETVIGSADDVAQEVCLAVVNALPGYTIKGLSFRAFVYGIASHKVTDAFRAIGRNRAEPVADLPDAPELHDGPEQRRWRPSSPQRLGGLLHQLTPRQREVLVLRVAVGLSAEETAAAVGLDAGRRAGHPAPGPQPAARRDHAARR